MNNFNRRRVLAALAALPWGVSARAASAPATLQRLATAWRLPDAQGGEQPHRLGIVEVDWGAGQVRLLGQQTAPGRPHGLLALPDGGFVAVGSRPGHWLWRLDKHGVPSQRLDMDPGTTSRSLNGHVESSASGQWLYTTETETHSQAGWISVRDSRNLEKVAEFNTGGIDAHQLLRDDTGALLVANGGLLRDAAGRKVERHRMAPSLSRLQPETGAMLGQWQLHDPRLSLRHLAWAAPQAGQPRLLGIALQAEHQAAEQRRQAPALAVWNGQQLTLPSLDAAAAGYAGDIAAGPLGGFVISAQRAGRCLWWHPGQPGQMTVVATLTEPCALANCPSDGSVFISAGRGLARWHVQQPAQAQRWPAAWAPDNHWVLLHTA